MSFALAADIAIAGKSASFLQAFARIGLLPDGGSTWFLPRLVGEQRARALAMLAPKISAEQAKEWGLIWDVVEDGELMKTATEVARGLADGPTLSLARIKEAMNRASGNQLSQQLDLERDFQRELGRSEDFKEGVYGLPRQAQAQLQGQVGGSMTTPHKEIASGLQFPEGPVAMPDGSVILVEIERQTLTRASRPTASMHVIATLGGGPNGAAMGPERQDLRDQQRRLQLDRAPDGRLVPGHAGRRLQGRLASRWSIPRPASSRRSTTRCDGRKLRGPNDLVFDGAGGFWFTDLGKTRERDTDRGAVYYAKADGSKIEEAIFPLERPNGMRPLARRARRSTWSRRRRRAAGRFELSAPGRDRVGQRPVPRREGPRGHGPRRLPDVRLAGRRFGDGHICVATLITGAVSDISPDGSR